MTSRTKNILLVLLLALGMLYRLCAAYPTDIGRFAPASSALQAMHILSGERPIFYSGQAWMGPAGAYIIAMMFKLFGASSLTLGLFSWLMSVLFLLGAVVLAYRLFGVDNALVVAALFLVPISYLMHLAGQPRAHYTICFVFVPIVLLMTLGLLRRHREGRPLRWAAFFLGLFCGFAFWTNMAIGPAIGISVLLLLWHLRKTFFTRALPPWFAGWVLGFSPVIWYNLVHQAIFVEQVDADNTQHLGRVLKAFVTNAWPHFWGVDFNQTASPALRALFVALLVWIGVLYVWMFVQGLLRWRRGEDVLGYQVVFGYFGLHFAVTAVSSYGSRFETGTPLSYVGTLFSVAFCIPALVLQSGLSRRAKALTLLPLTLLFVNNLVANAAYPSKFITTLREQGLSRVTSYPNESNPHLQFCRERGLATGYLGRSFRGDSFKYQNFLLNLECFGQVVFSDPSGERYVESALATDAARRIFWVNADTNALRTIGATSKSEQSAGFEFQSEFRVEHRETAVIPHRLTAGSQNRPRAGLITDRNYDTSWEIGPQEIGGAILDFAFDQPEKIRQVVIFPTDVHRNPGNIAIEVSDDGAKWRPVLEVTEAIPMFWSVWHPFLKQVKPRMEIVLPRAAAVRFCRLRFTQSRNKAGLAIREVLFLGDGPGIDPQDWEQEIDDVVRAVREQGKGAVIVGDHWFMNFFQQQGFATDFISNETISDTGELNPNLNAPVALDFLRPQLIIAPKAFLPAVEKLLRDRGIPFSETSLRYHVLCLTRPAKVAPSLFWNGLELNDLARTDGG